VLDAFYRRVRPGGPGLGRVSPRLGFGGSRYRAARWRGPTGSPASSRLRDALRHRQAHLRRDRDGMAMLAVAAAAFYWIIAIFRSEVGA
jgi:hypothetical protein